MSDTLTTQELRKKFKNTFELCNFAIGVARNMIANGSQVTLSGTLDAVNDRVKTIGKKDFA
jgi:hypothetical protein